MEIMKRKPPSAGIRTASKLHAIEAERLCRDVGGELLDGSPVTGHCDVYKPICHTNLVATGATAVRLGGIYIGSRRG